MALSSFPSASQRRPSVGAGMVCFRGESVLLIKRAKPPRMAEWSIPGGHVEWGETLAEAALRETFEETSIRAEIADIIEIIDAITPAADGAAPERHYVLVDFAGRWLSGEPMAGDDASDAAFVPLIDLHNFGLWSETLRVILKAAQMLQIPAPNLSDQFPPRSF